MLRDARQHFEQRAAREQTTIENVLATFARDFDAWLDRERRGNHFAQAQPRDLVRDLAGARRAAFRSSPSAPVEPSLRREAAAEAQSLELQHRLDEESRRIEELERRLAEAEHRAERQTAEAPIIVASPALALAAPTPRQPRRRATVFIMALVFLGALVGVARLAQHSVAAPPELRAALARLDDYATEMETRGRSALGHLAASHAREDALAALLAEDKDYVIARAVASDPQLTRAKIDALAPSRSAPPPRRRPNHRRATRSPLRPGSPHPKLRPRRPKRRRRPRRRPSGFLPRSSARKSPRPFGASKIATSPGRRWPPRASSISPPASPLVAAGTIAKPIPSIAGTASAA